MEASRRAQLALQGMRSSEPIGNQE